MPTGVLYKLLTHHQLFCKIELHFSNTFISFSSLQPRDYYNFKEVLSNNKINNYRFIPYQLESVVAKAWHYSVCSVARWLSSCPQSLHKYHVLTACPFWSFSLTQPKASTLLHLPSWSLDHGTMSWHMWLDGTVALNTSAGMRSVVSCPLPLLSQPVSLYQRMPPESL